MQNITVGCIFMAREYHIWILHHRISLGVKFELIRVCILHIDVSQRLKIMTNFQDPPWGK